MTSTSLNPTALTALGPRSPRSPVALERRKLLRLTECSVLYRDATILKRKKASHCLLATTGLVTIISRHLALQVESLLASLSYLVPGTALLETTQ
jgi:hypothetical protein